MRSVTRNIVVSLLVVGAFITPAIGQSLPVGSWVLGSYNFNQAEKLAIDTTKVTLNIREGGKLGGRSACNVYGGNYAVKRGQLKIKNLISTMMACEEPAMQFERNFHTVLDSPLTFQVRKGTLIIKDVRTGKFLRFKRSS
jgi:heat shock protein HslJ